MRCDVCGQDPCQTEGFCGFCRQNDRDPKVIAERQGAGGKLPKYWESMDVGALWDALNDPRRSRAKRGGDAPQATYDALVWSLIHNNGWSNKERRQGNARRLQELSDRQVRDLIAALRRKNCHPDLIADIEGLA